MVDFCFGCGQAGHVRKRCPNPVNLGAVSRKLIKFTFSYLKGVRASKKSGSANKACHDGHSHRNCHQSAGVLISDLGSKSKCHVADQWNEFNAKGENRHVAKPNTSHPTARAIAKTTTSVNQSDSEGHESSEDENTVFLPLERPISIIPSSRNTLTGIIKVGPTDVHSTLNAQAPEFIPEPILSAAMSVDIHSEEEMDKLSSVTVLTPPSWEELCDDDDRFVVSMACAMSSSLPHHVMDVGEPSTVDSPLTEPVTVSSPQICESKGDNSSDDTIHTETVSKQSSNSIVISDEPHCPLIEVSQLDNPVDDEIPTELIPAVSISPEPKPDFLRCSTRESKPPLRMKFDAQGNTVFSRQFQNCGIFAALRKKVLETNYL